MSARKSLHHHGRKEKERRRSAADKGPPAAGRRKLEIVLKSDTAGSVEAATAAVNALSLPEVGISIIGSGVDDVHQSDIFMAETGSRLVIGFNVGFAPHVDRLAAERQVEIRLYDVIYRLVEDLQAIAESLVPGESVEEIIGTARVIALFKSSRRGIILGCEVLDGRLRTGSAFRVIGAMGPVYSGRIESLHIDRDAVREAVKGQKAGLKIRDFNKARIGDLVESFHVSPGQSGRPWQPRGRILYR